MIFAVCPLYEPDGGRQLTVDSRDSTYVVSTIDMLTWMVSGAPLHCNQHAFMLQMLCIQYSQSSDHLDRLCQRAFSQRKAPLHSCAKTFDIAMLKILSICPGRRMAHLLLPALQGVTLPGSNQPIRLNYAWDRASSRTASAPAPAPITLSAPIPEALQVNYASAACSAIVYPFQTPSSNNLRCKKSNAVICCSSQQAHRL